MATPQVLQAPARALGGERTQLVRFAGVGVGSTAAHLGLFLAFRSLGGGSQWSNAVALVVATLANTAVNRRWTFEVHGRGHAVRHHLQALAVFALTWAMSAAALQALRALWPDCSPAVQVVVIASAMVASTVVRFAAMRSWIFRAGR